MFKHAFDNWGLENVEDMSAEQYNEALDMVHEQLSTHQHLRKAWKLENDQGPNDVTERDTEQAWYSGTPTRYKNFSYRVLTYFVNDLQHGATPLTCSERVFEEALRRTNQRCQNLFRGLPAAAHYQGPQCFAERQSAAKLTFDPSQVPRQSTSHTRHSDGAFIVLQCTRPECAKWRRVDDATYHLYYQKWIDAEKKVRRQALCDYSPHLVAELQKIFREHLVLYHGQYYGRPRTLPFKFDSNRVQRCLEASRLCQEAHAWHPRNFWNS